MEFRSAVVTGAASGIGLGIARKFLAEGFGVFMFDISAQALDEAAAGLRANYPGGVFTFAGDVASERDWASVFEAASGAFGGVGAVVNNAGIGISKWVGDLSIGEWRRVVDTNLTSVFLSAKFFGRSLSESAGAMVNIASTRAAMSERDTEAYSATKGGVVAITHALAMSLAPARVNCISPGWIDNGKNSPQTQADLAQHPVGRAGFPADVAELAFFLADPEKSGFITGQNFSCDGGMTKKMIYV